MSASLKINAGQPGEAIVTLVGQAIHHGQKLNIAFPQFASIPAQQVIEQQVQGDDLLLTIDADSLGDVLEAGSPCQIKIPELNIISTVIWPEIIGRRSAARRVVGAATVAKPAPIIAKTEPEIVAPKDPEINHDETIERKEPEIGNFPKELDDDVPIIRQDPPKKTIFLIICAAIIVCLVTAGGAWYYVHSVKKEEAIAPPKREKVEEVKKDNKPTPQKPAETLVKPEQKVEKAPTPPVETLEKMSVADVIKKAPSTAMITQEGERRLANKQSDDGVLLLENAASKGDATAMLKLGMLYNPVNFKEGGPIPSPDMREAARYFQKAAQQGAKDADAPRAALHDWLTKKAEAGDTMAKLTLKDFWP